MREVEGRTAPGSGSVAGRDEAERGGIWVEGIFPPGSGGIPPVGASDEARGPGDCDGADGAKLTCPSPGAGRVRVRGGSGAVVEGAAGEAGSFAEPPPAEGNGVVGGRVAARRCICEVMAREMAAEVGLGGWTEGSERVGGRAGAGSVVRRNWAVEGRAWLMGGAAVGAAGVKSAGPWGEAAGDLIEPEADGPMVRRIWPVTGCGTWSCEGATAPVAGRGSEPERGSRVTRGTVAVVGGLGTSGPGGVVGASSGISVKLEIPRKISRAQHSRRISPEGQSAPL
jgi:hypothetical protein